MAEAEGELSGLKGEAREVRAGRVDPRAEARAGVVADFREEV
jgi:hypothetical protein